MALPSFPGGTASKVADLYEVAWTVDSLLDLVAREVDELHLEPHSEDGLGIEFFRVLPSGEREYHSVKRQAPGSLSGWTPAELTRSDPASGRSILSDLFGHLDRSHVARAVFVSQDSARALRELSQRAQSAPSAEEFRELLSLDLDESLGRLTRSLGRDEADLYGKLRRSEFSTVGHQDLIRFVEQRIPALVQASDGKPAEPSEVRACLGDFAWHHLGQIVRAAEVVSELQKHGYSEQPLAKATQIRTAIKDQNDTHLNRVGKTLVNGLHIPRSQVTDIVKELTTGDQSLLLAGSAGDGKTCVVAQVIEELRAADVPHLAISMDELGGVARSAQLGQQMGLPSSPAIVLGQMAAGRRAVLCIDQLDAISFVSGRNPQGKRVLDELVAQVSRYPQLRMLLACRSFDLDGDSSLSSLVRGDSPGARRIEVERLSTEDVYSALASAGLHDQDLAASQIELLRVPLHLFLFLGGGTNRARFGSRQDLFDRYWDEKRRRVDEFVGVGSFVQAVERLSNVLSSRQQLQAPPLQLTGHEAALDAMASEAVVFIEDGSVRFFHEAFFDYAFARTFLQTDADLVEWLTLDEQQQPLFRRSQVRQVLAFLREPTSDRLLYLQTVQGLLREEKVRFHIKKLVLDWIGSLLQPTGEEWLVLEELPQGLEAHVWGAISSSVPWFDLFRSMGRLESWLTANDERIDRVVMFLQTPDVLNARAPEVAKLVLPFVGQSDVWRERLWWIARRERGFDSPEMQDLLIGLVADGTLDDVGPGTFTDRSLWFVLYGLSTETPAFAAKVLGAWFDRQLERAPELGLDVPLSDELGLVVDSQSSEHAIQECSRLAPLEFVSELFPRLIRLDESIPPQPIRAPGTHGGLHEQLREALAQAMSVLARDDPEALDSIMEAEFPNGRECTSWMSALVLRAWSANPDSYAHRIVRFLLENPEERLQLGYDIWLGDTDFLAAISRSAVNAASSKCSDTSFGELENAILYLARRSSRQSPLFERTELALLRALHPGRIGEETSHRISELEHRFPEATERGAPKPPSDRTLQWVGSPISAETRAGTTDDEWLSTMVEYPDEGPTWRNGDFVGGSGEVSRELEAATSDDPARFVALAHRMDSSQVPAYFEAILRGVTRSETSADRAGTLEQVSAVLRRISQLGVRVRGAEAARAIEALADEDIPNDIVDLLCHVALHDPDPASDTWQEPHSTWGAPGAEAITQAINSSRGAAAIALARLLFADSSRWSSLKPTIEVLVTDRVLAVRAVAVRCLLAILDAYRSDALAGFSRLTEGADAILASWYVAEFMRYAIFRDYSAVRPIIEGLLNSASPEAVQSGAKLVTLASLWVDEAREDGDRLLVMDEAARAGAAEVYAANLGDETVGPECERHLVAFFEDESDAVRKEAGNCWGALSPDQLASKGPFIDAFARSPTFDAHSAGLLVHHLQKAQEPLPVELCDLAERSVAQFGDKATSIQFAEAGVASELSKLIVQLLDETEDPELEVRILDAIDDMQQAGFLGIDDQVKGRYDR